MMLELAIEMFLKYKELCPEKFERMTDYVWFCDRLTNRAVIHYRSQVSGPTPAGDSQATRG